MLDISSGMVCARTLRVRFWTSPAASITRTGYLALVSIMAAFLVSCGPTAQQEANEKALKLVTDTVEPVAQVDRRSFPTGNPREAVINSMPTERGAQVLKGEVLRNDAVSQTVAKLGIPDAVEATTDSYILFYHDLSQTIVIDNSVLYTDCHGLILQCRTKASGAVLRDLPIVPGYARVFGFNEAVSGPWPVSLTPADVACFSVPPIPQPPPPEITDGSDYRSTAQQILNNVIVVNQGPDYDRAQRAFARLTEVASAGGLNWKLYVYEDTYDAGYGVPDGSIFITTKLVEYLDDDQLTAVLAHLMAHERYGHSRNSMKRVNQASAALLAGSVLLFIPTLGQSWLMLVPAIGFQVSNYRQMLGVFRYLDSEELEADALAAQFLAQLHLPPGTIVSAMYKASRRPLARDGSSGVDVNLWFGKLHSVEKNGPDYGKLLDAGRVRLNIPPPATN